MKIKSYRREYTVTFSENTDFIEPLILGDNTYVIADENIIKLYPEIHKTVLKQHHTIIQATEENKTLETAEHIIDELIGMDSRKKTNLVALGGGIIQDLTCFIASTIYRGINWTLVPTTLLAQTDSCIGSKSSINYKQYKNIIGTFYPPTEIIICPLFLKSLTNRDYYSGLGEIAKIQLMISPENFFNFSKDLEKILKHDYLKTIEYMESTLSFKKNLIELDEFDTGIRNTLNFGHTFGHAIETTTNYYVPHGQAVSIGILIANKISVMNNLISSEYEQTVRVTLYRIISEEYKNGSIFNIDKIIRSMKMDKKYTGTHNCILLTEDGAKMFNNIPEKDIIQAMESVFEF